MIFATAVVFVLAAVGVVQIARVHSSYGAWNLWPGPRTPKIVVAGNDYLRGNTVSVVPPDATVRLGTAPGAGEIFAAPLITGASPTVLYVRYPDATVTVYSLSGGP